MEVLSKITGFNDFEEARRGWELSDIIKSEDLEIIDNQECELCGQTSLNTYFIITYPDNCQSLTVGSSCITKMILFQGVSTQEDSNRFFEKRKTQINSIKSIRELITEIFLDPVDSQSMMRFRKLCANVLNLSHENEFKGMYLSEKWFNLLEILNHNMPDNKLSEKQENRIKAILFNPKGIEVIKQRIQKDKPIETFKKWHRIVTTLSRSKSYKNPDELSKSAKEDIINER